MLPSNKDEINNWFDYSCSPTKRLIYIGSRSTDLTVDQESGTDYQMAEFLIKAIIHLNQISSKPIYIHMNNLGGDFYHGMAIYDAIRASPSHIYGICWGYAMSMGSLIAQACDSRIIAPHCTFMIHDTYESISGTSKNIESWGKYSAKLRRHMYGIYLERMKEAKPKFDLKKIEQLCSKDTIFSAEETVNYGLMDWVMESLNDPYKYHATNKQKNKWNSGVKLGKHRTNK